jgi:hypothetical protein
MEIAESVCRGCHGRITEYRLDTPMSGPHGLVADRDGNIWFTAQILRRLHRQARPELRKDRGVPAACWRN